MKRVNFKNSTGAHLYGRPTVIFMIRAFIMMLAIGVCAVSCGGGGSKPQQTATPETQTEQAKPKVEGLFGAFGLTDEDVTPKGSTLIKTGLVLALLTILPGSIFARKGGLSLVPLYAEEYNRRTDKMTGKVWYSENNYRQESLVEGNTVIIYRSDSAKVYMIHHPQKKTITVISMSQLPGLAKNLTGAKDVTTADELIGRENIEGYECEHHRTTNTMVDQNGKTGRYYRDSWWYEPYKLEIMSKEEGLDAVVVRNIKLGQQPASLFELPKDYKMEAMPDVQKQMQDMQQKMQDALKMLEGLNKK
jgi:hypothetical protein